MIRLACLDMAGTTLHVGDLVNEAFAAGLAAGGAPPDDPRHDPMMTAVRREMGRSKIEVFTELLGDHELAVRANIAFEESVAGAIASVEPIDGAAEAIDRMREAGVSVCLTTGFSAETRDALVEHLGWGHRVDLALSPSDGRRGRPAPDLVLAALMQLEVDNVRHVAAAGDTTNDLVAAHRAGCSIVAGVLTGAHDEAELASAPHTHLLASIADLPEIVLD